MYHAHIKCPRKPPKRLGKTPKIHMELQDDPIGLNDIVVGVTSAKPTTRPSMSSRFFSLFSRKKVHFEANGRKKRKTNKRK